MNVIKQLFFFVFILLNISLSAQDVIKKTSGQEIVCKVVEITPELVKFNKTSIKDGPLFTIYISNVDMIIFADGSKEVFNSSTNQSLNEESDIFIDTRDNRSYKTVQIGNQVWFAENLAFEIEDSWCYKKKDEYCEKYGRLYTYESAVKSCPVGWHLPSDEEWQELEIELGMIDGVEEFGWRGTTPGQGLLLKKGGGSGFNAIFAGYREDGTFWDIDNTAYFWTSSNYKNSSGYSLIRFLNQRASIKREYKINTVGLSVRCVKN
ncbi:MAG: FISUMP domain-containing protein [Bacteroidales bacterium]|jgi:uncharacterized protein (TIGR02145 family)|nr:FISUMP domain-containing protein [Bacteroidales bacterium]